MENLKKLLQFLSPLPFWLRVVIAALVTVIMSICISLTASSCGVTQTVVNNNDSDNSSIDMTINPSQSTSTTVTSEIPINAPLKNSIFAVFLLLTTSSSSGKLLTMRRMFVDADNENDARSKVSLFLDAFKYASDDSLESYQIHSIISLPPLFYLD